MYSKRHNARPFLSQTVKIRPRRQIPEVVPWRMRFITMYEKLIGKCYRFISWLYQIDAGILIFFVEDLAALALIAHTSFTLSSCCSSSYVIYASSEFLPQLQDWRLANINDNYMQFSIWRIVWITNRSWLHTPISPHFYALVMRGGCWEISHFYHFQFSEYSGCAYIFWDGKQLTIIEGSHYIWFKTVEVGCLALIFPCYRQEQICQTCQEIKSFLVQSHPSV